jgi:hypothetical protein
MLGMGAGAIGSEPAVGHGGFSGRECVLPQVDADASTMAAPRDASRRSAALAVALGRLARPPAAGTICAMMST